MNHCINCQKETSNPKYCSRSCCAKVTNKNPKRKLIRTCAKCDNLIRNHRSSLCEIHYAEISNNKKDVYQNSTLGEYTNRESVKNLHPSSIHSHIRNFARSWFKHLQKLPCANCGYSKHVELCHIKAIADFHETTLLKEINSSDNLIQLCRNCHWELDNQHITIEEIRSKCK